jgi:glycosyltransferase involved in cell wall biosynthesis
MAFNLLNKFVIGFSGYLGEWVDTDFLIDLFLELRKKSNSIAFMIIGEGPRLSNLKRQIKDNNFIFIGSLPGPKVAHYLFALNIGILPFKKTPVQDLTFHAKLVEYTVAKKMVVAAPLAEVARLNFPNIVTAGLSVDEWVKAIEQTRSMRWDSGWDGLTAGYDWTKISEKFGEVIEAK